MQNKETLAACRTTRIRNNVANSLLYMLFYCAYFKCRTLKTQEVKMSVVHKLIIVRLVALGGSLLVMMIVTPIVGSAKADVMQAPAKINRLAQEAKAIMPDYSLAMIKGDCAKAKGLLDRIVAKVDRALSLGRNFVNHADRLLSQPGASSAMGTRKLLAARNQLVSQMAGTTVARAHIINSHKCG